MVAKSKIMNRVGALPPEKLAFRPREFQETFGIRKSFFYEEVAKGRIEIIKCGKATLITREAASDWLALCAHETPRARVRGAVGKSR